MTKHKAPPPPPPPFSQWGIQQLKQNLIQRAHDSIHSTERKEKILSLQFNCVCSLPSSSLPSLLLPSLARALVLIRPNEAYSSNDQTTTAITNNCRLQQEQSRTNECSRSPLELVHTRRNRFAKIKELDDTIIGAVRFPLCVMCSGFNVSFDARRLAIGPRRRRRCQLPNGFMSVCICRFA